MKHRYQEIIYITGNEAEELILKIRDEDEGDIQEVLEYLKMWEMGEGEEWSEPPWGGNDHLIFRGPYVISYNYHLDYISLTRKIR